MAPIQLAGSTELISANQVMDLLDRSKGAYISYSIDKLILQYTTCIVNIDEHDENHREGGGAKLK